MDNFDIPTIILVILALVVAYMIIGVTLAIMGIVGYPLSRIFRGLANHIDIEFTWAMSPEEIIDDVNGYVLTWDMVQEKRPSGLKSRLSSMFLESNFPKLRSATRITLWRRHRHLEPDFESAWVQVWLPYQVRKWEYNLFFIRSNGSYLYFPIPMGRGNEFEGVPLSEDQLPDDVTRWIGKEDFPLTLEISRY